ncbi:MAG: hypothetical protein N3I35_12480 [Clostridia bacterium]|nr:hypothetical protein [Clostridia bacterium]
MTNLLWYILLGVISVVVSSYVIYKKRNIYKVSTLIVFYFFITGATWIGEFIVLGLFNSYVYKIGVFADPWAQNLLGHLILNTTLYPTTAILLVAYSLGYGWIILFTALYVLIEYVFIQLGIYEHHWWKYYMTAIVVIVYLSTAKYWFAKIIQKPIGIIRTLTFFFVAMLVIHTPTPILLLLGKQHYQLDLINKFFINFYISSIIVAFVNHLIMSFILIIFVCKLRKWYWRTVPFIISIITLTTYTNMGILVIDNGWKFIYYLLIEQICIATFILIEKYTLKPNVH